MKKLFNSKMKNKYFIDKVEFNYQIFISLKDNQSTKKELKSAYYYKQNKIKVITNSKNRYVLRFSSKHNGNRAARYFYKKELNLKFSGSIGHENDNYIPCKYRKVLKERGISIKDIQEKSIELIIKDANDYVKTIIIYLNKVLPEYSITTSPIRSLKSCEINWDIITNNGHYLVNSKSLKKALNQSTESLNSGDFIDKKGNTTLASLSCYKGKDSRRLKGYYKDKSQIQIYTKERSKNLILNRIETKFNGYKQLIKTLDGTTLKESNDFKKAIKVLANEAFRRHQDSMKITVKITKKIKGKIVKELCRQHFKENFDEAYMLLTSGKCCISTGKESTTLNKIKSKARQLARDNIFLKKDKHRVATYIIDFRYLQKNTDK